MVVSQLSLGLWDYVGGFFSYIPKIMYFIYTAIASVLDALQFVFRKLAGLDVFYVNGEAIKNTDPVLEFIMGILGIGENAPAYSALTTTFWSLVIFGAIVLVLTTMFAIIKSHYNEDSGKTNPITYIYTAIKSVLTFALVPVVVIASFWLSTFLLRTLDSITAGTNSVEQVEELFGSSSGYKDKFESYTNNRGDEVYGRYDIFGFGAASSNETFSGLIFKVAGYDANRLRRGGYNYKHGSESYPSFGDGKRDGWYYDFGVFGKNIPAGQDGQEWVAQQFDYAFANNIQLQKAVSLINVSDPGMSAISIATRDPFYALNTYVWSFSKYNVGLVYNYYDLWAFNFIIAFGAVIVIFGLAVSIVLGLITRIIKSAALFLIYPALLGLAPLDEFGAFKKWRGEFMQQILMAFGAIVGMNLFFLLLPFLNNIQFFNIPPMDYIMNILIVIAGLSMVKAFIGFLSGLIGGADAVKTGDDAKAGIKEVGGKAIGGALAAANVAMKVGKFIPGVGMAVGAAEKGLRMGVAKWRAGNAQKKANYENGEADKLEESLNWNGAATNLSDAKEKQTGLLTDYKRSNAALTNKYIKQAQAQGLSGEETTEFVNKKMHDHAMRNNQDYKTEYDKAQKTIDRKGLSAEEYKNFELAQEHRHNAEVATDRMKAIRTSNYMDEKGNMVPDFEKQMVANDARGLGGAIMKGLKDGMKDVGLNLSGLIGTFGRATNYKLDDKGKIDGVYGEAKAAATTQKELNDRREQSKLARGRFVDSLAGVMFGYGDAGKKEDAPKTGDKLGQSQLKEGEKQTKGIEDLGRKIDKLTDAILKGK